MADFSAVDLINQVVASTNQAAAGLTKRAAEIGQTTDQMQVLLGRGQASMQEAVGEAQAVAGQKAAIDYARNSGLERIQKIYRMDESQPNYAVAEDMAAYERTRTARVAVRSEYDQLAQVDMLSNPLGWLFAQIQLPQVAAKNNALAAQEDEALQDIRVRNELLGATKSNHIANTADAIQTAQIQEAAVKAKAGMGELQIQEAKNMALISAGRLQQAQLLDKIADDKRSAIGVIASIQGAEASRQMQKDNREAMTEQRRLNTLLLKEKLEEIEGKQAERDRLNVRFAEISSSMGHKVPMTVERLKTLGERERKAWWEAAQSSGYGATPDDATAFFLGKNNLQTTENVSVQATARNLDEGGKSFGTQARAALMPMGPDGKIAKATDAELREYAFQQYTKTQVQAMFDPKAKKDLASPDFDKLYNAYVAPFKSFSTAIDATPELAPLKNNLVKQQIDILIKAGAVKGDNLNASQQQQILAALQNKIADGSLPAKKVAADVSTFFRTASEYNRQMNKYELFGLPTQKNYQFTIDGIDKKVDLFDATATENALTRGAVTIRLPTEYNPMAGFRF